MIPACHSETLIQIFSEWIVKTQRAKEMKNPLDEEELLARVVCEAFDNREKALIYANRIVVLSNFMKENHKRLMKENLIQQKNGNVLFSYDLIDVIATIPLCVGERVTFKEFNLERKKHLLKNSTCINKLLI